MRDMNDQEMAIYFSGKKLYGDDFSQEEIEQWFADEKEGYFNLTEETKKNYSYGYHALNKKYGFSKLPAQLYGHVLGVGAAYGDELRPFVNRNNCETLTILEPSEGFNTEAVNEVPVRYVKPDPLGNLTFDDNTFDLITCLGVLHHIPNVSSVISEFYRVLSPEGYALIREPTGSMGDWRLSRPGLTKRERGIPFKILRSILLESGFTVISEGLCMFSLTSRLRYILPVPVFNSLFAVTIDRILCALPIWSNVYHPRHILQKLRPTSAFFVIKKEVKKY